MYKCICDTSVLNHLVKFSNDFHKTVELYIPDTMRKSKETRKNKKVQELVEEGNIKIIKIDHKDKEQIYLLIKKVFKKDIATTYRRGRMEHESIEYECAYSALKTNIPVYYFDKRAYNFCNQLLRKRRKEKLVRKIDDFLLEAPILKKTRSELAQHVYGMGYDLNPEVKKEFNLI